MFRVDSRSGILIPFLFPCGSACPCTVKSVHLEWHAREFISPRRVHASVDRRDALTSSEKVERHTSKVGLLVGPPSSHGPTSSTHTSARKTKSTPCFSFSLAGSRRGVCCTYVAAALCGELTSPRGRPSCVTYPSILRQQCALKRTSPEHVCRTIQHSLRGP